MSITINVKGKIIKNTGGDHYMFSDKSISMNSNGQISENAVEGSIILGDSNSYEPWKNFSRNDWYHCVFANTVNKRISVSDLGVNSDVQMCLTGITSIIRFEGYDMESKDQYKYHNWVYILNIYMNNRGELVEGSMNVISYKTDQKIGSIERSIEKPKGSDKVSIRKTEYQLKSKGKELHDEVFLDHQLIFSNGMKRAINFDSKTTDSDIFYDLFGDVLREASIFNRRSDVSYVFAGTESAESFLSSFNDRSGKLSLGIDCPLMAKAFDKYKGASLFKEIFGFLTYFTGSIDNIPSLYESVKNIRGPVQLTDTQCARMNPQGGFDTFIDRNYHMVTTDFEELGEALQNTNKKLKKDE